jgi:prevent-host-death family protein
LASLAKSLPRKSARPALISRSTRPGPVAAAKAKTHFLQLLDEVEQTRTAITISKRGRLVAQLMPMTEASDRSAFDLMFGRTQGWMAVTGDIVAPDHKSWGPDWR